jgi:urea carboxylase
VQRPEVQYRQAGDKYILIEYGPALLDLDVRFRVHALIDELRARNAPGVLELSPGVRSLQVKYDSRVLHQRGLMDALLSAEERLPAVKDMVVPTRVVRMPLSFEDSSTLEAIRRYSQSVRPKAPWLPSNIEFIRRLNGLASQDDVRRIVFEASYLTLGLGDVYLGAPCAVPLDPRHRVVTSKYNPARFYTPEGAVGIGGVYMCIYGMDSPGGYQLVGRTVPIWNKFLKNRDFEPGKPWLLRFFDQVRFYPVEERELAELRRDYAAGRAQLDISQEQFVLRDYHKFLASIADECAAFKATQTAAFNEERERWARDTDTAIVGGADAMDGRDGVDKPLADGHRSVDAHMTGNVWQIAVNPGDRVKQGDKLVVLEAMKMEFAVSAPSDGEIVEVICRQGRPVHAGQRLLVMQQ